MFHLFVAVLPKLIGTPTKVLLIVIPSTANGSSHSDNVNFDLIENYREYEAVDET